MIKQQGASQPDTFMPSGIPPGIRYREGSFDAGNIPPAQEDILFGYRQQIDYARKNMAPASEVLKRSSPAGTVIVEPMIKTK